MKSKPENPVTITAIQTIQLLYVLGYYDTKIAQYKERGICYGFAYANSFALLDKHPEIIDQRTCFLSKMHAHLCQEAKKLFQEKELVPGYNKTRVSSGLILDYLLSQLNFSLSANPKLFHILAALKEEAIKFMSTAEIGTENAYRHFTAYFDTLTSFTHNKLTLSISNSQQNARDIFSIFTPVKFSNHKKSLQTTETLGGVFNQTTLANALSILGNAILQEQGITNPIVFTLSGHLKTPNDEFAGHCILLSFDPIEKSWFLLDTYTSRVVTCSVLQTTNLAEEILKEFCNEKKLPTQTIWRNFYIHPVTAEPSELGLFNQLIISMKKSKAWQENLKIEEVREHYSACLSNMFADCLSVGTSQEITSLFSDPVYQDIIPQFSTLIFHLLQTRCQDPNLTGLLATLVKLGFSVQALDNDGGNAITQLVSIVQEYPHLYNDSMINTFEYLISQGVDINRPDRTNMTALAKAICREPINSNLVKFLLEHNANPNILYSRKNNHLMEILLYFYQNDPCPYYKDRGRQETEKDREASIVALMKLLIDYGADLEVKITHPDTPDQEISFIDYFKGVRDRHKGYNSRSETARVLTGVLDYYQQRKTATTSPPSL